jgi:hypothetical protein
MIIRDYIRRRVWWCAAAAICGWLVFPLSTAASGGKPSPLYIALGFALFGGAILALQWLVRCPKCNARLAQTIAMSVTFSWGRQRVNFCPFCAVNLDTPLPQPTAEPQNPIHPA